MQLFSADTAIFFKNFKHFFAHENMKKPLSKVAQNWPKFCFQYCQQTQNQPKSHFLPPCASSI